MPLSSEEQEALADRTAGKVIHALRTDKKAFWVQPEEHYNHHKRLAGWIGTVDWGAKIVGRAIIMAALAGLLALIILGTKRF